MGGPNEHIILVVEDEEPVRRMVCAMLSQSGYQTLEACDGEDALRVCDSQGDRVGMVLTDVSMPRMPGPDLARELKQRRPDIPVVFMSGFCEEWQLLQVNDLAAGFVAKPFTPGMLYETIRRALKARG